MSFSFIHAADLHLDSPLIGLSARDEHLGDAFAKASRQALDNLVDGAIAHRVAFVVISGDVYDGDWRDFSTGLTFSRAAARLAKADIPLFLIHGNHDAASAISPRLKLPDQTRVLSPHRPETIDLPALGVAIHGQSFWQRVVNDNLAQNYPPPRPDRFNIGLLHTACEGRAGHDPYAPCTVEQLVNHGYQYWALGHVHRREILHSHPHVVFAGNLQGRHVREIGPKGATLVRVAEGQVVGLTPLILDAARWAVVTVDAAAAQDLDELWSAVGNRLADATDAAEGRPLATRVVLHGATLLHDALVRRGIAALEAQCQSVAFELSEALWVERLRLETCPLDVPVAGTLGDLAAAIDTAAKDDEPRQALARELNTLLTKLPPELRGEFPADEAALDELFGTARALILARWQGE